MCTFLPNHVESCGHSHRLSVLRWLIEQNEFEAMVGRMDGWMDRFEDENLDHSFLGMEGWLVGTQK